MIHKNNMTQTQWKSLIASLPPGLSFSEAAVRLCMDYQAVRNAIRRYGYKAVDGRRFSPNKNIQFWYKDVNWQKSNVVIAREHGVSREMVRRIRKRLGHPRVESRGRKKK